MKQFTDLPISAQEREALAHPKYLAHLEELKKAVFNDENMRALRVGAEAKIEAWRTKQANIRAIKDIILICTTEKVFDNTFVMFYPVFNDSFY